MATFEVQIDTFLRGYHYYQQFWKNIDTDQKVIMRKQPNNRYDKNAIAGFVTGLNPSNDKALTEVGHLPRDLCKLLKSVTEDEISTASCYVVDNTAMGAKVLVYIFPAG